jgi:hypothetical protein
MAKAEADGLAELRRPATVAAESVPSCASAVLYAVAGHVHDGHRIFGGDLPGCHAAGQAVQDHADRHAGSWPVGCEPSSTPTGQRPNATSFTGRPSPPERSALLSMRPTGRSSWSKAPSQSDHTIADGAATRFHHYDGHVSRLSAGSVNERSDPVARDVRVTSAAAFRRVGPAASRQSPRPIGRP